jgi:hypothetical protein
VTLQIASSDPQYTVMPFIKKESCFKQNIGNYFHLEANYISLIEEKRPNVFLFLNFFISEYIISTMMRRIKDK